jgi:hypothetical protein
VQNWAASSSRVLLHDVITCGRQQCTSCE